MGSECSPESEAGGAVSEYWKTAAIVLAAGQGKRMQAGQPKQFMLLGGRPVLYYALAAFEKVR